MFRAKVRFRQVTLSCDSSFIIQVIFKKPFSDDHLGVFLLFALGKCCFVLLFVSCFIFVCFLLLRAQE